MVSLLHDLRYAIRTLRNAPSFTAVAVLMLALGIGANTAIFTAIDGLLLRTIPVDHPESLVRFRWTGDNEMGNNFSSYGYTDQIDGRNTEETFPYPIYQQLRATNKTLVDLIACAPTSQIAISIDGQTEVATALLASGNYFQLLGVHAVVGRLFTVDDDRVNAPPVAVVSHGFWLRRFGGDTTVIGRTLRVGSVNATIVGVTPPEFTGVQQVIAAPTDVTVPLAVDALFETRLREPATWWLQVMGRAKQGVTPQQVQGNFEGTFQSEARNGWSAYFGSLGPGERSAARNQNRTKVPRLIVQSAARGIYDVSDDVHRSIALLGVVVALVLLIVCANVANLLLSRATARQREISVRLSLGATPARLIRQLLTESMLLAAFGAVLGALVASWGRQLLPANLATATPIDWRILGFVGGLTIATGILFGIAPALRSSRVNVGSTIKEGGHTASGGRSRLGKTLVVAQVAISLVLLVGTGLFLRTVRNLQHVDVGFETDNILLVPVNLSLNRYEQPRILNLFKQLLDELPHVPGVRAVTASSPALLTGNVSRTGIYIQGRAKPTDRNTINRMLVAPNFFDAMGIRLVAGRSITGRDTDQSAKVAVINDAATRKYFANESPVGKRFGLSFETTGDFEIIGIVKDIKYNSVRDAAPPTMYLPYSQARQGNMTFEFRTAADPSQLVSGVREAMRRIDPNIPILKISTQTEQIEQRFAQERVFAQAYALFGGLALLIASVGLFGLMSYSVARRTHEIGLRMALGAERAAVVMMIMRESLALVVIGVVIGTAGALGAGRFVSNLLFNLAPTDPVTITVSSVVLIAVSLLAGYLPARTASRVDPMTALRTE